jgi:uncharacterized membrane protein YkoI
MTMKHWLTGVGAGSLLVMGGLLAGPVASFASNSTTAPSAVVAQQEADGEQDPSYIGTIHIDDSVEMSEDQEAATLQSLATITQDQAEQAALASAPGASVAKVELDNENGWVVYSVTLDNGTEVKVDAGDGQVLSTEADEGDSEANDHENGQEHEDDNGTDTDDIQDEN